MCSPRVCPRDRASHIRDGVLRRDACRVASHFVRNGRGPSGPPAAVQARTSAPLRSGAPEHRLPRSMSTAVRESGSSAARAPGIRRSLRKAPASRCQDAGCGMRDAGGVDTGVGRRGERSGPCPCGEMPESSLRLGGWWKKPSSGPEGRYGWPGPGEEAAAAGPGRNGLRCAAERTAHSTTWSPPQRATGTEDGIHGPGPEARRRRCARAPVTRRVWKRTSLRAPVKDRSRRCPGRAASEETGWHIVGPEPAA